MTINDLNLDWDNECWRCENFPHHYISKEGSKLVRINNGSFGAAPKSVLEYQSALSSEWLYNPDDFWISLEDRFTGVCLRIANEVLKCDWKDVFLIDNLTTAISTLLHSILIGHKKEKEAQHEIYDKQEVVLTSSFTYNAVKNAVSYCCNMASTNFEIVEVDIPFPLLHNDTTSIIIDCYKRSLSEIRSAGKKVKLAVVDHLSSNPSILMPVKELVSICREYEVEEVNHVYFYYM